MKKLFTILSLMCVAGTSQAAVTRYLQSRETLQSGTTFYVSSGTVSGALRVSSLTVTTSGTLNISSLTVSGQVNIPMVSYRAPNLVWIDTSTIDLEAQATDGTTNKTCVMFRDGDRRCVAETTAPGTHAYRRFIDLQPARFGVAMNGGLNPTEVIRSSTAYAFYAVRSTAAANTTDFAIVASTLAPINTNVSSLNTAFTSNGWVYIGTAFYWDNGAKPGFQRFSQAGAMTITRNRNIVVGGVGYGIVMTTTTTTTDFFYTPTSGMLGTSFRGQVPPNLTFIFGGFEATAVAQNAAMYIRDQTTAADLWRIGTPATGGALAGWNFTLWHNATAALEFANSPTGSALGIYIAGWVDGALAGGPFAMF